MRRARPVLRYRYLIKTDPRPGAFQPWQRTNRLAWNKFPGEKKVVSGKTVILHLGERFRG